jgi:predicted amidohydrolase YtcJ
MVVTADAVAPSATEAKPGFGVAIRDGRVLAVAPAAELDALTGPDTVVEHNAGLLLPGFFDSHNHMLMTGMGMLSPDLGGCRSIADVLGVVRTAAERAARGQWIVTSPAWHESSLAEQRMPTAEELDSAAAGHPVFMRRGGHNLVLSTTAFRLLGVGETSTAGARARRRCLREGRRHQSRRAWPDAGGHRPAAPARRRRRPQAAGPDDVADRQQRP